MALKLIGSHSRLTRPCNDIVEPLAKILLGKGDASTVVGAFYKAAGKNIPGNISIVVAGWKKKVQKAIDAGNEAIIDLCKEYKIVEDDDKVDNAWCDDEPKPANKNRK